MCLHIRFAYEQVTYMVKPITKETLFMNCMELDFATKVELEHWMATFEEKVWTEDVMKELSKAGLVRRTVAQVWNKQNHRLTSTFEYEDENAYKACQKIIEEKNLEVVQLDSIDAGDCTFHFGWTIHGAGLNKSDKIREAMVVTYYADGSRVGKLDTKDRKGDAELFLGGKKAGEIANHPMNKIVYQR